MRVAYLGEDTLAAGFGLAGAHWQTPSEDPEAQLAALGEHHDLVLISASVAGRIPPQRLALHQAALQPLLLVLPPIAEAAAVDAVVGRIERQLGLHEDAGP